MDYKTALSHKGIDCMRVDIEKIINEMKTLPFFRDQIMLQGVKDNADYFYGTGKATEYVETENEFVHPLFDIPYTNSIIKMLELKRTRLINLFPQTCYTMHKDYTPRVHIPLITNEKCFLIVDNEMIHLPADGNVHIIDTTKNHTAINASTKNRYHIVGVVDKDYSL